MISPSGCWACTGRDEYDPWLASWEHLNERGRQMGCNLVQGHVGSPVRGQGCAQTAAGLSVLLTCTFLLERVRSRGLCLPRQRFPGQLGGMRVHWVPSDLAWLIFNLSPHPWPPATPHPRWCSWCVTFLGVWGKDNADLDGLPCPCHSWSWPQLRMT